MGPQGCRRLPDAGRVARDPIQQPAERQTSPIAPAKAVSAPRVNPAPPPTSTTVSATTPGGRAKCPRRFVEFRLPFVNKVKAGQTGPPGDRSRRNHAAISSCHPDNFDPSTVTEETMRDIGALNKEMMAAGSRKPRRSRCGRSPKARCSSRTDRIWKLRSTLEAFGSWKSLTWTRHSHGAARMSSPAGRR